jgi:hypothetical protein
MKNKMIYAVLVASVVISLSILRSTDGMTNKYAINQNLSFAVRTDKTNFTLGEPIKVEFVLTNQGSTSVKVPNEGVESGSLKIYVANEGGEYKRYFASGWGRETGTAITLQPGKSQSYYATILWNGKSKLIHFSEDEMKEALRGRISTEYALPLPGVYFLKGVSSISSGRDEVGFEPLKIIVKEPTGDDLEVWNKIKGNREIALLMQKGSFDTSNSAEKQSLIGLVEQIIVEHPNSVYTSYLRPNLEKYKIAEARRQEMMNKMQKPQ